MNVPTIEMPAEQARAKLKAYRRQLHKRADEEYSAAAAGYQALADGHRLINLQDVFRNVPFDDQERPRMAIARADRKQVRFHWASRSTRASFDTEAQSPTRGPANQWPTLVRWVDLGRTHDGDTYWGIEGFALVPMVPADVRDQVGRCNLRNLFVLWEVEQWADRSIRPQPDRDPYLLKHVGGDLYAVLAEWDLTDLERAVMAGRAER